MRGTLKGGTSFDCCTGIIPAYAGNTFAVRTGACRRWDHPRVCGEHLVLANFLTSLVGSSPRMRGTPTGEKRQMAKLGIIPAYAGNTDLHSLLIGQIGDHPRVCGEHHLVRQGPWACEGSSPRMRGTPISAVHVNNSAGIIPAYAGNTCFR